MILLQPTPLPSHSSLYLEYSAILSRRGIDRSYGKNIFHFLRNCPNVSKVATSFYIPTSNVVGFQFLHIITNTCSFLFSRHDVVSHCSFDLHLRND